MSYLLICNSVFEELYIILIVFIFNHNFKISMHYVIPQESKFY